MNTATLFISTTEIMQLPTKVYTFMIIPTWNSSERIYREWMYQVVKPTENRFERY